MLKSFSSAFYAASFEYFSFTFLNLHTKKINKQRKKISKMDPDKMTRAMARWWQVRKKNECRVCVSWCMNLLQKQSWPPFLSKIENIILSLHFKHYTQVVQFIALERHDFQCHLLNTHFYHTLTNTQECASAFANLPMQMEK